MYKDMNKFKYCQKANKFLAVDPPGNCLVGPYLPNGLVRLGPDTIPFQNTSGYKSKDPIIRFSHTHVGGTGGGGRYGNIGITPYIGSARLSIDPFEKKKETADPGYYSVSLEPAGITAELTVTQRTGAHRYTFPENKAANLLIDAGALIQTYPYGKPEGARCIGGFIEAVSSSEIMGRSDCKGGWGHDFPYSVYFFAKLNTPFTACLCADSYGFAHPTKADGANSRITMEFGELRTLEVRVGISFVSVENAKKNLESESMPFTFGQIRENARDIWENTFSKIDVQGGSDKHTSIFYSLFARLVCGPTDLGTDENPYWKPKSRSFTDFYALWDSVRNVNSFISLFDPDLETDILNCLLEIAEHSGWLHDAWIAGHGAMMQGGSSADILFCEAALKGLSGIDYEKALRYMKKNNEVQSPNKSVCGRHLDDYLSLGYLSTNVPRSRVSKHIEYTYQDWCIGRLAKHLGHNEIAERYYKSSMNLWNLWRDDIKLFAPKKPDGSFDKTFQPDFFREDSWNDTNFYEATAWQWMYSAHHDFAGLIERHGGDEEFINRLDKFFDDGHYYSKETMLHIPYLYIYAGRPEKTCERVHKCLDLYFRNTRDGLDDNEDMGCQSAFFMCSGIGLYPIMGQDLYMLTAPIFKKTTMKLGKSGKVLIINAPESDSEHIYIIDASLNGEPLNRAWIRHCEIANGAVITLKLGKTPNDWGKKELPPSPIRQVFDK